MPTIICSSLSGNKKYPYAYGMGLRSYLLGLIVSANYDRLSGTSIVWCLATLATITAFFIKATSK
jgi:ABC-type Mn2+/Zn2+ transport system permease subunit